MRFFLTFLGVAALAMAATAAPAFPPLSGRVVDAAHLLDAATAQQLTAELAQLEAQTGDQLVVVTVLSLGGETIEDYGVALGRHWGIGQKDKSNGALLIVAPNEHKVRIEVGYGLEGTLTDAATSHIVQQTILPRFKAHAMAEGIVAGVSDIQYALTGGKFSTDTPVAASSHGSHAGGGNGLVVLIVIVLFLFSQVVLFALYLVGSLLAGVCALFGWMGPRAYFDRQRGRILPADKLLWLWLLTPSHRIGGSSSYFDNDSGNSGGGFSGGGGSFGGGGSSGSW